MSIFFEIIEKNGQTTVHPIGKRAGILGIVSFFVLVAAWVEVFIHADYFLTSIGGAMLLGVFTLFILSIPSLIGWIDHLPSWFFPSTKKLGPGGYLLDLQIYSYSLNGTSKSILKADVGALHQRLADRRKTVSVIALVLIVIIIAFFLLRYFSSK